jgi:hypothetical protein
LNILILCLLLTHQKQQNEKPAPGGNTGRLNRNNLKVFKNIANDTNTCFYPADLGG